MRSDKKYMPVDGKGKDVYNTYYMHVADRYRLVKWLLLLLFTVYLVVMLFWHRESITQENFAYLLRDFNVSAVSDGGFSSVVYEERQNMAFASFKGELVVASMSDIAFYNGTGAVSFKDTTDCRTPVLASSNKYLLVYDKGGRAYAFYTAIACVKQGETESVIQTADISDSGVCAIVTRSRESKYAVNLYNASFREIARYYRDTYVTDISINASGDQLAILSISQDQSSLCGTLTLCEIGTNSVLDIQLGEHLPLTASYLTDGTLAVVSEDGIRLFDQEGIEKNTLKFSSVSLSAMDITPMNIAVVCQEDTLGSQSRVMLLSVDGTLVADVHFDEKILSVTASSVYNRAYVTTQNAVWMVENGEKMLLKTYSEKLSSLREIAGRPILCFTSHAQTAVSK